MDDPTAQDQGGAISGVAPVSYGGKEQQEQVETSEEVGVQEIKEPEVPPEVEGWVERVERGDIQLPQPVSHRGQTLVQSAQPKQVHVVLPLSEEGVIRGLHLKVIYSLRWLAEWCIRLLKKFPGKVLYRTKN